MWVRSPQGVLPTGDMKSSALIQFGPKLDLINRRQSPIVEADIGEIISAVVARGNLRATDDSAEAVLSTDLSFICVRHLPAPL